jgi:hydrogenase maturation protein HypF
MGRLFDAVGAMCGIAAEVTYEGQAAVELEAAAWRSRPDAAPRSRPDAAWRSRPDGAGAYEFELHGSELDPRPAIQAIANDLASGVDPAVVSAGFHAGVARATVSMLIHLASDRGLDTAVLSGGVFQNRLLLETIESGLTSHGLRVLVPELLPPNDGGISYGQAAIAAATMA